MGKKFADLKKVHLFWKRKSWIWKKFTVFFKKIHKFYKSSWILKKEFINFEKVCESKYIHAFEKSLRDSKKFHEFEKVHVFVKKDS